MGSEGERAYLSQIKVGDNIRFVYGDETKTGKVYRIVENYSGRRKRIFLDKSEYVLNLFDDSIIDAYYEAPDLPSAVEAVKEKVTSMGAIKTLKKFSKIPVGEAFGIDLVGSGGHLYVKVGDNSWSMFDMEGSKYMAFSVYRGYTDVDVFDQMMEVGGGKKCPPLVGQEV